VALSIHELSDILRNDVYNSEKWRDIVTDATASAEASERDGRCPWCTSLNFAPRHRASECRNAVDVKSVCACLGSGTNDITRASRKSWVLRADKSAATIRTRILHDTCSALLDTGRTGSSTAVYLRAFLATHLARASCSHDKTFWAQLNAKLSELSKRAPDAQPCHAPHFEALADHAFLGLAPFQSKRALSLRNARGGGRRGQCASPL